MRPLVTTVAAGVRGGILGVGLIVPALTLAAFEAARARHTTDAAALQAQLLPLAREVAGVLGPAGIEGGDGCGGVAGRARAAAAATARRGYARTSGRVETAPSTVPA